MTPTPHTAEALAAEMQRYGVTTMNRWATDGAALIRSQAQEIERLTACLKQANDQTEEFERKWYLCRDELEDERDALRAQLAAIHAQPAEQWQFRWLNPNNNPNVDTSELAWKPVDARANRTVEEKVAELRAYKWTGGIAMYECRALIAKPEQTK